MKSLNKLSRAEMKNVTGGTFPVGDPCKDKGSTTYCRDGNNKDIKSITGTGCGTGWFDRCPDGASESYSTCTC